MCIKHKWKNDKNLQFICYFLAQTSNFMESLLVHNQEIVQYMNL